MIKLLVYLYLYLSACIYWPLIWTICEIPYCVRVTQLSLTKYFRDCQSRFILQKWSQKYDKFPTSFTDTYPFCKTTRGYLYVAIAKNLQNLDAILCYRFAACSFANCMWWLHLNSLTIPKKNCQWNLWKTVAKIFGQWKSGCTIASLNFVIFPIYFITI